MARIVPVLAALALGGCLRPSFAPGDRVVARWQSSFRGATVLEARGNLITVQWDVRPPDTAGVPAAWAVAAGSPTPVPPGSWLLCEGENRWTLCRVREVHGEVFVVDGEDGAGVEVDRSETLPVPKALHAWAEREGPRQVARARGMEALADAVPARAGQAVEKGMRVLAKWTDGTWWEATVSGVSEAGVEVAWADGSAATTLDRLGVAPLENVVPLAEGAAAFCRWKTGTRWWRALVTRASGASLAVDYADGDRARLRPGDCRAREPARIRDDRLFGGPGGTPLRRRPGSLADAVASGNRGSGPGPSRSPRPGHPDESGPDPQIGHDRVAL